MPDTSPFVNVDKEKYVPQKYDTAPACLAPALKVEDLARVESVISKLDARLKEYATGLLHMVETFLQTPESTEKDVMIPVVLGTEKKDIPARPLEEAEYKRIFDVVPWEDEIEMMSQAFNALPTGQDAQGKVIDQEAYELRNTCFHLVWYARELTRDREPMTQEFCLKD